MTKAMAEYYAAKLADAHRWLTQPDAPTGFAQHGAPQTWHEAALQFVALVAREIAAEAPQRHQKRLALHLEQCGVFRGLPNTQRGS